MRHGMKPLVLILTMLMLSVPTLAAEEPQGQPARGTVIALIGSKAVVDIGTKDGITIGMTLSVLRSQETKDAKDQAVGALKVVEVDENKAIGKIVWGGDLQQGDLVIVASRPAEQAAEYEAELNRLVDETTRYADTQLEEQASGDAGGLKRVSQIRDLLAQLHGLLDARAQALQQGANVSQYDAQISAILEELGAIHGTVPASEGTTLGPGEEKPVLDTISENLAKIIEIVHQVKALRAELSGEEATSTGGGEYEYSVGLDEGSSTTTGEEYAEGSSQGESQSDTEAPQGDLLEPLPQVKSESRALRGRHGQGTMARPMLAEATQKITPTPFGGAGYTSIYLKTSNTSSGKRWTLMINGLLLGIYESGKSITLDPFLEPGKKNTIAWEFTYEGPWVVIKAKHPGHDEWTTIYEWRSRKDRLRDSISLPFAGAGK